MHPLHTEGNAAVHRTKGHEAEWINIANVRADEGTVEQEQLRFAGLHQRWADDHPFVRVCEVRVVEVPKCNRTACDRSASLFLRHNDNGKLYCPRCARLINETNPGLIPWPNKDVIALFAALGLD